MNEIRPGVTLFHTITSYRVSDDLIRKFLTKLPTDYLTQKKGQGIVRGNTPFLQLINTFSLGLIMKKFLLICVFLLVVVPFAHATLIEYEVDGDNSDVTFSNNTASWFLGSATITGDLIVGNVGGTLHDGETATIDFFTLTVSSTGFFAAGQYNISAALAFTLPKVETATGTGGGYFGSVSGVINFGTLYWDPVSLPYEFTLSDGTLFSVDFQNGIALTRGDTATVHAYITNRGGGSEGTPVSEPANMLLMGTALVGLAGVSRKKIFKKL